MPPKAGKQAKGKGKRRADSEEEYDSDCLSDDAPKAAKAKKPRRGKGKDAGADTATLIARLSRSQLEKILLDSCDSGAPVSREDIEALLDPAQVRC